MNKAKITISLAIITTLNLSGSALAATTTLSTTTLITPTITSPTFTLTSDPVITTTPPPTNGTTTGTTTSDPTTTTTTNTTTSSTTPVPGTFDPAVLRGPSSGTTTTTTPQPTDQTPITTTETPPTAVTPIKPTTTTPTRPVIPPRTTNTPSNQPEPAITPECPAPTPTNPAPICPVAVNTPIIPSLPWTLIWTPILGVVLFGSIVYFFQNSSSHTEKKLGKLHSKNQTRQIVEKNRNKSYREFLDYITLELTSQSSHNQAVLDHLNAKINLLGSPEIQSLSNQISSAINQGHKSEAKNLLRQFAIQIKKEF